MYADRSYSYGPSARSSDFTPVGVDSAASLESLSETFTGSALAYYRPAVQGGATGTGRRVRGVGREQLAVREGGTGRASAAGLSGDGGLVAGTGTFMHRAVNGTAGGI